MMYLSYFQNHWGHFLTESISRLWPKIAFPELIDISTLYAGLAGGTITVRYADSLEAFGLRFGDNLKWHRTEVKFKKRIYSNCIVF
jgi:hypothetical protein